MKRLFSLLILTAILVGYTKNASATNYQIFSISQDFPMGEAGEVLKKNYFLNMGEKQGLDTGTILNVFRSVSEVDNTVAGKRYDLKVKVGEIKIIHVDKETAIAIEEEAKKRQESAIRFDIPALMIGDQIEIKLGQN